MKPSGPAAGGGIPGRRIAAAALAAPALLYLAVLARHTFDVPRGDDYFSVLPFLSDWTVTPSAGGKASLLFAQYFSHRIVLTKLAAWLQWRLTGSCNFAVLQHAGRIAWAALAAGLLWLTPSVRRFPWLALSVPLLLMQPQGYTNLTSGMQAVQNIGVVLAAFGALASAARGAFGLSLPLALVAALASVNGLLVFPAAAAGLWIRGSRRAAALHAGGGILAMGAYFAGYAWPHEPLRPGTFLANAGIMAGSFADLGRAPLAVPLAAGLALIALCVFCLLRRKTWSLLPAHASFLLFLLLSVGLAAGGRMHVNSDYMLQNRYRLYGLLMLCSLILLATESWSGRRRFALAAGSALFSAAFCFLSYLNYLPGLLTESRWCEAAAINRQLGNSFPVASADSWAISVRALERAEALGIYRLPPILSQADVEKIRSLPPGPAGGPPVFRARPNGGIGGYSALPAGIPPEPSAFAVALIDRKRIVLPRANWRVRLADLVSRGLFFNPGFSFILPEAVSAAGSHRLYGVSWLPGRGAEISWIGTLEVPADPAAGQP